MQVHDRDYEKLFIRGEFSRLVESWQTRRPSVSNRRWLVGALCFQGKILEAQELLKDQKLSAEEMFFLCLGFTRASQYKKARRWLDELKALKSEESHRFFFYQAAAFFTHFFCRYQVSLKLAQKAYLASLRQDFPLWRLFALDLVGHNLVHAGDIHRGIESLKEASKLAHTLGNAGFVQATEISVLNYQSQFTTRPAEDKARLQKTLRGLSQTDNYSESILLLRLTHLELLMGQMGEAATTLLEAQKVIFGKNLSRHRGAWHFEHAYLLYLSGSRLPALQELALARQCINSQVEKKLLLKILGLEHKLLEQLGENNKTQAEQIETLSQFIGDPSTLNKLSRLKQQPLLNTQDPLQKLFDEFQTDEWQNSIYKIVQQGYLGILREKIVVQHELIMLKGLWVNGLIFISPEEIHLVQKNVGQLPLKALQLLFDHERLSKEKLVNLLWGYEYDPGRHDTLLYALIHRVRSLLGPFSPRLIGSDHYYRLEGVKKTLELGQRLAPAETLNKSFPQRAEWNIRQYQIVDLMRDGRFWSVSEYATHFHVTTMTALRDLRSLHQKNMLLKIGSARATRYGLNKE